MTAPNTLTADAVESIKKVIQEQKKSPVDPMGLCDRCSKNAKSQFLLPGHETPLLFCAHHMRAHLGGLMAAGPVSFWVAAEDLWTVRGVEVPAQNHRRSGDGLTDA